MYFPTSVASQLCTVPSLPTAPEESVLDITPSARKSLFCALTASSIQLWRVRPPALLGHLVRSSVSIAQHGSNKAVFWTPDATRLVVQTTESFLVLITIDYQATADTKPYDPLLGAQAQRTFQAGPGEAAQLQSVVLLLDGVIRVDGGLTSVSPRRDYILFSTMDPPTIQRMPWPTAPDEEDEGTHTPRTPMPQDIDPTYNYESWTLNEQDFPWLVDSDVYIRRIAWSRNTDVETWITSDGRAYFVQLAETLGAPSNASSSDVQTEADPPSLEQGPGAQWYGACIHAVTVPRWVQKRRASDDPGDFELPRRALAVAVNNRFSLTAVGTHSGTVELASFPTSTGTVPTAQELSIPQSYGADTRGPVYAMEWSSDAYVLAVAFERGWAVWSVAGRCLAWSFGAVDDVDRETFGDAFMFGARALFWAPGDFELIMLAHPQDDKPDGQLFSIPFAKSATTAQHTPDNSEYAFLQMEDRVLVYRGADQPDMSVINPESDVWQHVKIPARYIASNWPMQYSSISSDGRLIAVAGRRGLIHYSATSGRWKSFADEQQEQAFVVRGGLLWFHHVLIAAIEVIGGRSWQLRLYSRDLELSAQNTLHREMLSAPAVLMALVDNSLLVYTADNVLTHYLVVPTEASIALRMCGSIGFEGVIAHPAAVRALSWMIPSAQKQLGDPVDDLANATVLMMVGGQLVLLRPRKTADQEVSYDMQVLANRIEFCWIHLRGIGSLENSLWGFDGQAMRIWLNALAIDTEPEVGGEDVKESVHIPLDFYPLSVLMNKGIIIGAESEIAARSNLSFVSFRHSTSSHLFLHHILLTHLSANRVREAVIFASHYEHLVFFAHALEILLHTVVEADADMQSELEREADRTLRPGDDEDENDSVTKREKESALPATIEFLDHFDVSLDVVVGCARKTEMTRWRRLFDIVGEPRVLFEKCLGSGRLRTAGSYLLVLQSLEQLGSSHDDTLRLLCKAVGAKDWTLCRELLRFLHSVDGSGDALREALEQPFMQDTGGGLGLNGVKTV
ncbi:RIC1-domain-containing protein [Peniophora sp. CONT]|nr:RIC1-domain-containing protein [Peniophora sp. CONT]